MDADEADSVHSPIEQWTGRLAHPIVLSVGLAVIVGVFAHSLVFVDLSGIGLVKFETIPIGSEATHFAWFCSGCGLALMFAAFAMLR